MQPDGFPVLFWKARPDMSCEYVSPAWLDFTGCAAQDALGDGWARGVHPEDLARWLDACVRAFDARRPFEVEYRLRRRDGVYRWMLDRALPRYERETFAGYVGLLFDIDERKRTEASLARSLERERRSRIATEEASRMKDGFLAAVLQDLETPVQAMAAWAGHLREQALSDSEAARALEAIERNALSQQRMIASLIELSRLFRGGVGCGRPALKSPLLNGVRVLVVDDDVEIAAAVIHVLRVAGAETRSAAGTAEALSALEAWRPDVLLADLSMASGDAYALIRAVRSLPAEMGGCLRAAALAATNSGDAPRSLAAGYDAQLARPVEPVALLATVARLAQPVGV